VPAPDHDDDLDHDTVTRRSFERQAGLFARADSPFAAAARPARPPEWLEPLDPAQLVLDAACGAGHVAEQVAPHVRQVVGLDLTRALLDVGAARLAEAGIGNVLLQEGDATELPFVDASFDLVYSRTALHHFVDPARPVAEMARVCRPGGRVAVLDMVAPDPSVRRRFDELHRRADPSHAGVLLADELADLVDTRVGPLRADPLTTTFTLPLDVMLTDAGDPDSVRAALRAELAGDPPSGFAPVLDGDQLHVSFTMVTVDAVRASR